LERAVVSFAAQHMAAAGMESAIVANFASNAPSEALYRSAGFEPWHVLDGYVKAVVIDRLPRPADCDADR
jgi:RimJ/RimL family protein N-acetyltransferase